MNIETKYAECCAIESDINHLLPYIRQYAAMGESYTEMGVRRPTSIYAGLSAGCKVVRGYDIGRYPEVDELEQLAKDAGVDFEFIQKDVLTIDIEPCDMLFIDTWHVYGQLKAELARHAPNVKTRIGFHDTTSFEWVNEDAYEGVSQGLEPGVGLWPAIQELLDTGEWVIEFRTTINNGLTIIKRA